MTYENLPAVILELHDGNLSIMPEDNTPRVLVLGTAGQGVADLVRVTRPSLAVAEFGTEGTLIRGLYESRAGGATNIYLKRINTTLAKLTGIGDSTGVGGITVEPVEAGLAGGAHVKIFWDDSEKLLQIWNQLDQLVYDSALGFDAGAVIVSGDAVGVTGSDIGTATVPVVMSAVVAAGTVYTAGTDGLAPTRMKLYEALDKAYREMDGWPINYVVPMDVSMDDLNIADDQSFISTVGLGAVGTGNGVKTAFDLPYSRVVPSTMVVEVDNAPITDYVLSPGTGINGVDQIIIDALERDVVNEAVGSGTSGHQTTFDLDEAGVIEDTLAVKVGGITVTAVTLSPGTGTLGVDQIVFSVAPAENSAITASYTWSGPLKTPQALAASYKYITKDALLYLRTYEEDYEVKYEWHTAKSRVVGQTTHTYHEVNFAHQLANFCQQQAINDRMILGAIGVKSPRSLAYKDIAAWVGSAPTLNLQGAVTANGAGLLGNKFMAGTTGHPNPGFWASESGFLDDVSSYDVKVNEDIGKYLSILTVPVTFFNTPLDLTGYGYRGSAAAYYIGFMAALDTSKAPTNKVITNVSCPYKLSKSRQNDLVGSHYVVIADREQGTIIVDAPTAATTASDFTRVSTMRIVGEYSDRVRAVCFPFLGNGFNGTKRAGMQTAVQKVGSDMIDEGKIQGVNSQVTATQLQAVQGQATVEVSLTPAFELRQVDLVIGLALPTQTT